MNTVIEEEPSQILIIDDNPASIRMLSGMLGDMGRILFATSGQAGIELAREHKPHLILLDVEMPVMKGYEVCQLIKDDPETSDISIIIMTAQSTIESEIQALEAGAADFITKPLNHPVVRARVQSQLKLQRQANTLLKLVNQDGLTGLFNRRYFEQSIETEFLRHRRQNLPLSLALLDIDHFKAFNDGYGHLEGDACLQLVAKTIASALKRPGEVAARYGGEEFVVIFPHTSTDQARLSTEWLCSSVRELQRPHAFSSTANIVTVSAGFSTVVPSADTTIRNLIDAADKALYLAKASGRNQVCAYEYPKT